MTTDNVNPGRRRFLIGATSVVGAAGAVGIAVPFLSSWQPSAKARSAGASMKFNISKMEPGSMVTLEWRRQPIYVVRRTPESLDLLKTIPNEDLKDADSLLSDQPSYAQNVERSSDPEFLVLKAVCTHLGCAPKYHPKPGDLDADWKGGFFCPCHGSKFDLAGRVYSGAPAGANLPIPPYMIDGGVITVGEDGGAA